jgi:hypothetical protein
MIPAKSSLFWESYLQSEECQLKEW